MDKRYTSITVTRELKQKLKILAAKKRMSLNSLIREFYEGKYGKEI